MLQSKLSMVKVTGQGYTPSIHKFISEYFDIFWNVTQNIKIC